MRARRRRSLSNRDRRRPLDLRRDAATLAEIDARTPLERCARRSSVWFPDSGRRAGFPLRTHLRDLDPAVAARTLNEILAASAPPLEATMAESMLASFGPTPTAEFFAPFQSRYAAGLWTRIAPQDACTTPVDFDRARSGARGELAPVGCNATFACPRGGLDALARSLVRECDVRCAREVVAIDIRSRVVSAADGACWRVQGIAESLVEEHAAGARLAL